jgi:SAM-dependent methyltransferase
MTLIEEIRDYWNIRSSGFSDSILYDMDNRSDKILEKMEDYLGDREIKDVLDLGCGPGFYALMFGSKGFNVTGIDYSDKMIEEAKRNASDRGVEATFLVMDAQNLDLPDSSFDLVVSRDVFWCLEHPEKAYAEILRVLRPGGMAIVSDGNYYLHLYNEDYAKGREEAKKAYSDRNVKSGHDYFNKDKVDFKIIEDLVRNVPLSHEIRPRWDVGTLCDLGCDDITVHIRHKRHHEGKDLVFSFDIIFIKGDNDGN